MDSPRKVAATATLAESVVTELLPVDGSGEGDSGALRRIMMVPSLFGREPTVALPYPPFVRAVRLVVGGAASFCDLRRAGEAAAATHARAPRAVGRGRTPAGSRGRARRQRAPWS